MPNVGSPPPRSTMSPTIVPVSSGSAVASTLVCQAAFGAVIEQRGGAGVELLDRGRHAAHVGAVRIQLLAGPDVHHVGAGIRARARHLAGQNPLRGGKIGGLRAGGEQQDEQDGESEQTGHAAFEPTKPGGGIEVAAS